MKYSSCNFSVGPTTRKLPCCCHTKLSSPPLPLMEERQGKVTGVSCAFPKYKRRRNALHWPSSYKTFRTGQLKILASDWAQVLLFFFFNQISANSKRWAHLHSPVGHCQALSHPIHPPPRPPNQTTILTSAEGRVLSCSPLLAPGVSCEVGSWIVFGKRHVPKVK